MRLGFLFAATVALGWLTASAPASACKCAVREPADYYASADHALHVKVLEIVQRDEFSVTYRAELLENDFKGCLKARSKVLLGTAGSSAACGAALAVGTEALVYALDVDEEEVPPASETEDTDQGLLALDLAPVPGQPFLSTNSCSGTRPWKQVTAQHRDFLVTRPSKKCPGQRQGFCEGQPAVACLVNPCQVSQCDVQGAVCQASYCGGCNARWFAPDTGEQVCGPRSGCNFDDPARRYVARSPEQCRVVKFACQEGEEMFFSDCGCGCERR